MREAGSQMKGRNIFEQLGLGSIPWVIRVYLVLVLSFLTLFIVLSFGDKSMGAINFAAEGLKTVLAALLGALSQIGHRRSIARNDADESKG